MMSTGVEPLSPFIVLPGIRFQDITEHVRDDIEITFVASFDLMSHTTWSNIALSATPPRFFLLGRIFTSETFGRLNHFFFLCSHALLHKMVVKEFRFWFWCSCDKKECSMTGEQTKNAYRPCIITCQAYFLHIHDPPSQPVPAVHHGGGLNLFTNVKLDHSTICSCSYMFTQFDWHEKNLVTLILKITVFPLCQKIMNFTYKLLSKTKIKNWVLQKLDTVGTQWNAVVVTINSKKLSGHRVQKRWKCPVPCQLMFFLGLVG